MTASATRVMYRCMALINTNKRGIVKPDAAGYYDLPMGALNYENEENEFYPLEPAKKLFESSSSLMKRVREGILRGEYGHPVQGLNESDKEFIWRASRITEKNVSHHIAEVGLENDKELAANGEPIILIMGRIKPSGPYGDTLAEQLENNQENVCFSIRAWTDDFETMPLHVVKELLDIITWDYVNEPGIGKATKYNAPTMESLGKPRSYSKQAVMSLRDDLKKMGITMESSNAGVERLVEAAGWTRSSSNSELIVPPSAGWTRR